MGRDEARSGAVGHSTGDACGMSSHRRGRKRYQRTDTITCGHVDVARAAAVDAVYALVTAADEALDHPHWDDDGEVAVTDIRLAHGAARRAACEATAEELRRLLPRALRVDLVPDPQGDMITYSVDGHPWPDVLAELRLSDVGRAAQVTERLTRLLDAASEMLRVDGKYMPYMFALRD